MKGISEGISTQFSKVYSPPVASQPCSPRRFTIKRAISTRSSGQEPTARLWNESSMSLTREKSPSHKIPSARRFGAKQEDELKMQQFMTVELRRNICSQRGTRFPKSCRPQHFVKGLGQLGPSPASYNPQQSIEDYKYSTIAFNNYSPQTSSHRGSAKGRSFSLFKNHHKSYMPHTKHRFYQPQNIQGQPGPGKYNQSFVDKPQPSCYSMRVALKKFNETINLNPGPGAYGEIISERIRSPNVKGTMPMSKRTYLTKFDSNPSPHQYKVTRFMESQ